MRQPAARAALALLLLAHTAAALAGFLAPYPPEQQHRDHPWTPPSRLLWSGGRLAVRNAGDSAATPIRWFVKTPAGWKLFAAEPAPLFPLGSDGLGRDQFSRLLYGARVSLYAGLAAALLSAGLGLALGGIAGFAGGWTERLVMQGADLFLALPWMYLLLAARAFFPLNTDPHLVFGLVLAMLGVVGWARPARLVRAVVLSSKERDYVLAAKGFGAGTGYLLARHVLPETTPVVLTYLSVAIPQYIAAEATLSFLGLGFSGAIPSWGGLIAALSSLEVLTWYWWMWAPALAFGVILACYSVVSNGLRDARGDIG